MAKRVGDLISQFRETMQEQDETNSHFSDKEIMHWMDFAQNYICTKIDFIVERTTLTSVADQRQYALPDNFKKVLRVRYNGQKLIPTTRRYEDLSSALWEKEDNIATPYKYHIEGSNLHLIPIPGTNGDDIELVHISMPTELTTFEQEPDIKETIILNGLVSYALFRGYRKMKQAKVAGDYYREFSEVVKVARELTNDKNADLIMQFKDVKRNGRREIRTPEKWG